MGVNRVTCQTLFEAILINQSIALCLFNCQICIYAFRFARWIKREKFDTRNCKELLMRTVLFTKPEIIAGLYMDYAKPPFECYPECTSLATLFINQYKEFIVHTHLKVPLVNSRCLTKSINWNIDGAHYTYVT